MSIIPQAPQLYEGKEITMDPAALVISQRFNLPLIDLLQQRLDELRQG
jgi:hypothetical protein